MKLLLALEHMKGMRMNTFMSKQLQLATSLHNMLATKASYSQRETILEILLPNAELKEKMTGLSGKVVKYVSETKIEVVIQEMLHFQSLLARSLEFEKSLPKYEAGGESQSTVVHVLVEVQDLHKKADAVFVRGGNCSAR